MNVLRRLFGLAAVGAAIKFVTAKLRRRRDHTPAPSGEGAGGSPVAEEPQAGGD